jgi:hypothetical protein
MFVPAFRGTSLRTKPGVVRVGRTAAEYDADETDAAVTVAAAAGWWCGVIDEVVVFDAVLAVDRVVAVVLADERRVAAGWCVRVPFDARAEWAGFEELVAAATGCAPMTTPASTSKIDVTLRVVHSLINVPASGTIARRSDP